MDSLSPGFEEVIQLGLTAWGIQVTTPELALLRRHFEALSAANQTMNLTRITDPTDAAVKHYLDSLAILAWEHSKKVQQGDPFDMNLLDVGTGAGFPAVPIAIVRPQWRITALDGTRKKAEFVRRIARDLDLKNLVVEHGHSDHWKSDEQFDLVTTRAVASLSDVMRTCRRFVRKTGRVVTYKTASLSDEEVSEAKHTADELHMVIEDPFLYELECGPELLTRALYTVRAA